MYPFPAQQAVPPQPQPAPVLPTQNLANAGAGLASLNQQTLELMDSLLSKGHSFIGTITESSIR